METTAGFSSSNRSGFYLGGRSNCSWKWHCRSRRGAGGLFLLSDFGVVLASLATTGRAIDKWISHVPLLCLSHVPLLWVSHVALSGGEPCPMPSCPSFQSSPHLLRVLAKRPNLQRCHQQQ